MLVLVLVQAGRPAIKPAARAIWSARDMQHITNRDTALTHGYVSIMVEKKWLDTLNII